MSHLIYLLGMTKYFRKVFASLCVLSVVFACTPPAEAQFLKKLSKGLEKVNKTLKDANDILDGRVPARSSDSSKKSSSSSQSTMSVSSATESASDDNDNWTALEPQQRTPYVSSRTRFMSLEQSEDISPVYEDIFAISHRSGNMSFWRVDGQKLFDAEWQYCGFSSTVGTKFPAFNSGVAPAKRTVANSAGNKVICLLYANGGIKELDPTWNQVSDFADGLAVVKQKIGRSISHFYINIKGEKVFPHLPIGYTSSNNSPIRPLKDGLRAYPAADEANYLGTKWGYIDAAGTIVIEPEYSSVEDFSEGYAWVKTSDNQVCLIDKSGAVRFTSNVQYLYDVSPVKNGIFYVETNEGYDYYDTSGNKLETFDAATPFYDGYAFVSKEGSYKDGISLINTNFRALRTFPSKNFNGISSLSNQPRFGDFGLATVMNSSYESTVINAKGDVLLSSYDDDQGNVAFDHFAQFTPCGYALFGVGTYGADKYRGIMRPDGEIMILFSAKAVEDIRNEELPEDPIKRPIINDPIPGPWPPDTVIIEKDARLCPIVIDRTRYNVTVSTEGEGSARISPSGTLEYGDKATLITSPAEGWKFANVTVESEIQNSVDESNSFVVKSNMHLRVKFLKKDDDLPPPATGCFQGTKSLIVDDADFGEVTYYAQINSDAAEATPYGDSTHGFIVAMIDPTKRVSNDDVSAYFFVAPLKVSGYQFDDTTETEWMVLDGGSFNAGNVKVNPEAVGGLFALYVQSVLALNDATCPSADPRHYRIEMLDHNKETGEFTCGRLQTYSTSYGWLEAGDERLRTSEKKTFLTVSDTGLPSDIFQGVKFRQSSKRDDVRWYPPIEWYNGNQDAYSQILEQMKEMYRTFQSDYEELFSE